jgi:transposase-like protein
MSGFLGLDELFEGRHFDQQVIILCIRWYLRFRLSCRDLVEMMAERGLPMAHTTIMRWVHRYVPEFERRRVYLYRAVDREGHTVDFRVSTERDVAAAKAFFRKTIKSQGATPRTIALDGYAASHRAVREMKADGHLTPTQSCGHQNI